MNISAIQSPWWRRGVALAVSLALIVMLDIEIGHGSCKANYSISSIQQIRSM